MENIFALTLPGLTGYVSSYLCPVIPRETGGTRLLPPVTFMIVWPILYFLLGLSWVDLRAPKVGSVHPASLFNASFNVDTLFAFHILGLVAWILVNGCVSTRTPLIYIMLYILVTGLMIWVFAIRSGSNTAYYLVPHIVWLIFALILTVKLN